MAPGGVGRPEEATTVGSQRGSGSRDGREAAPPTSDLAGAAEGYRVRMRWALLTIIRPIRLLRLVPPFDTCRGGRA